jgi:putative transposase
LLVRDQVYHIFNRGVARANIFYFINDFKRFLELINYYRNENTPVSYSHFKKLEAIKQKDISAYLGKKNNLHVEILAFCLMDNHYHFLIKQVNDIGIRTFVSNIQNSYAKYFNTKHKRVGPLFQPVFKSVRIESDDQLLHVSRYIHLNPVTSYKINIQEINKYYWSSIASYIPSHNIAYTFVNPNLILDQFKEKYFYQRFLNDQADYQRQLAKIKHLIPKD